jgi:glycolate oxidase iron-sulfur subunit
METHLAPEFADSAQGREAGAILRTCVHCGFCNATCPTYRLRGDELDGPRGRIYLMKQMLEGQQVSARTLTHLDRCLTCRNCETTCPSGVAYGRLLDIGREIAEKLIARPLDERLKRVALRHTLPHGARFALGLTLGHVFKSLLPGTLADKIPARASASTAWPEPRHARRMLVLEGCVQPALAPNINRAAARVLDRLGISLIRAPGAGCCGALPQHLAAPDEARTFMRRNIVAWWTHIEAGCEAIVITASGCGVQVKDYGYYLRDDAAYAARAERVSLLARDIAEVVACELDASDHGWFATRDTRRIAFQSPCTLQHGQKLPGLVEDILIRTGSELVPVRDSHLCCGSAGAYSLLQADIANTLRDAKLAALSEHQPDIIATANIGCLTHLAAAASVPVRHWIELLDQI